MIKVEAPGKLMFSGEWSVLEIGNPAIVLALDRKVKAVIDKSREIVLDAPEFGIKNVKAEFDGAQLKVAGLSAEQEKEIVFLKKSVEVALRFLKEKKVKIRHFRISTYSGEMQKEKVKVGFGSSAALCVAAVFGVARFHGKKLKPLEVFKLATLAHFFAQGKIGSGFDVAASAFGGVVWYKRFDPKFLEDAATKSIGWFVKEKWPGLEIKKITFPKKLKFLVAFSGKKADTRELVGRINKFKAREKDVYLYIINSISEVTKQLFLALKKGNEKSILKLLQENRLLLRQLGEESKTGLESRELAEIIETTESFGAAAKFCGAGGGDSAIAVSFDGKKLEALKKALNKKGFSIINAGISTSGVKAYA